MAERNAACAIMIARSKDRTYYLILRRDPRGKWANAIMLGPAESREKSDRGRMVSTLFRGLKEELHLSRENILRVTPYLMNVETTRGFTLPRGEPVSGSEILDSHRYAAHFFLVEVPLPVLRGIKREINAGHHDELRGADIHRGLPSLLRATVMNPHSPYIQPHTRMALEHMRRSLRAPNGGGGSTHSFRAGGPSLRRSRKPRSRGR